MWLFILGASLLPVGAASAATAQRVGPETGYPKAQCLDGSRLEESTPFFDPPMVLLIDYFWELA